jgi:hypothetical protein
MNDTIGRAVGGLDSKSGLEIENAWISLRTHGSALMPYFKQAYPRFKTSAGRAALVFYATQYARISDDAFELGHAALKDRSKIVRNRACGLLAYSLRAQAITSLLGVMGDADAEVRQSAKAAITAIKAQNHHLFADRTGSGKVQWVVNPEDECKR